MKTLYFLARIIKFTAISIIYRSLRSFLRFFFYKVVVKLYGKYFHYANKFGIISRNNTFISAMRQRMVHILLITLCILLIISNITKSTQAQTFNKNSEKTILGQLVENEFSSLEEEELIEEFFDQESVISPIQQSYLNNLSTVKPQPSAMMDNAESQEPIAAENQAVISQEGTSLVKTEQVETHKTELPRDAIIYYEVAQGDTVSTIAQKFNVSVNTILWDNDLSAYSVIRPGDKLSVLPVNGVTHTVAKGENLSTIAGKYSIDMQQIVAANKLSDASQLKIGDKLIIPGGKKQTYTPYKQPAYSGYTIIKDIVENISKPKSAPKTGNKMAWPTVGSRITQYFSWRHNAVDIANKVGTPIYAADAGTVEYIGWGTGYGNQIVVNHGGGKKTRYAHLSKFYCKKGETVSKGEAIGAMGSTGWSTGSHLHFEVIINGAKYNPLNYIR